VSRRHRRGEPDLVRELQDQADWSSWRRTFAPIRGLGRKRLPADPSLKTVIEVAMIAALLVLAIGALFWLLGRLF
jgi:hypothetical protein